MGSVSPLLPASLVAGGNRSGSFIWSTLTHLYQRETTVSRAGSMDYFDPMKGPFWATLGVATLCGAIIGMERQIKRKPLGVRTSIMICLSTAVFIHLGVSHQGSLGDPTRVLGQLVTGVGFLGAGVILSKDGIVTGVTTAAVIWLLAAIGACVGFGHLLSAIVLSITSIMILVLIEQLEKRFPTKPSQNHSHE